MLAGGKLKTVVIVVLLACFAASSFAADIPYAREFGANGLSVYVLATRAMNFGFAAPASEARISVYLKTTNPGTKAFQIAIKFQDGERAKEALSLVTRSSCNYECPSVAVFPYSGDNPTITSLKVTELTESQATEF